MNEVKNKQLCPCGTGNAYFDCCGAFISNQKIPSNPEALMRSRYTAYTQVNLDYIAQTMKSPAADNFNAQNAREWAKRAKWVKLEVVKASQEFNKGIVEFRAHYHMDGQEHVLQEISEFNFENGRWYYVDGRLPNKKPAANQ